MLFTITKNAAKKKIVAQNATTTTTTTTTTKMQQPQQQMKHNLENWVLAPRARFPALPLLPDELSLFAKIKKSFDRIRYLQAV